MEQAIATGQPPSAERIAFARGLDRFTQGVALVGFCGLVVMALLTFYDGAARTLSWPRLSGFNDYGELAYPVVIASCFPAVLLRRGNVTVRLLEKGMGARAALWLEGAAAFVTLIFFAVLAWQLVRLTGDYYASARTTRTIEMLLAPWWTVTASVMALCVPVQLFVAFDWLRAAMTNTRPATEFLEPLGEGL